MVNYFFSPGFGNIGAGNRKLISRLQFEVCILDPWFQARVAPQSAVAHLKRTSRLAVSARLCATASTCTGTAQVSAGTRGLPRNGRACMPPSSYILCATGGPCKSLHIACRIPCPRRRGQPGQDARRRRAATNPSPLASSLATRTLHHQPRATCIPACFGKQRRHA